jgi:hypothetical protein
MAAEMLRLLVGRRGRPAGAGAVDAADLVAAYDRLAHLVFFEGERASYVGTHLRAINLARGHEQAALLASASLVMMYTPLQGRSRGYAARAERQMAAASPRDRAWAHEQLCLRALSLGDLAAAARHADAGRDLFARLRSRRSWSECAALGSYASLQSGRLQDFVERMASLMAGATALSEPAGIAWAGTARFYALLRLTPDGPCPDPDMNLSAMDEWAGRVVDPNTQLLWQGVRAWWLVRHGEGEAARRTLQTFLRLDQQSTMPAIYALNGFTGAVCAASELRSELGAAVLTSLRRFARTLPGARPTLALMEARWAAAQGDATAARHALSQLPALLSPDADEAGFSLGLMPEQR